MNIVIVPEPKDVHQYAADLFQSLVSEHREAAAVLAVRKHPK